jgi:hypothetical protein
MQLSSATHHSTLLAPGDWTSSICRHLEQLSRLQHTRVRVLPHRLSQWVPQLQERTEPGDPPQ